MKILNIGCDPSVLDALTHKRDNIEVFVAADLASAEDMLENHQFDFVLCTDELEAGTLNEQGYQVVVVSDGTPGEPPHPEAMEFVIRELERAPTPEIQASQPFRPWSGETFPQRNNQRRRRRDNRRSRR